MKSKDLDQEDYSTVEVARLLGLAVRSVQLMVDRGDLDAWKTPGGHRRIRRESLQRWMDRRHAGEPRPAREEAPAARTDVLLIEDSRHYQNLIRLLVGQHFPQVRLESADDGITGLALVGRLNPRVLIVDILLPGIDGAALITALRSHPQFERMKLVVVTSLEGADLDPYLFAIRGLPVVHKSELVTALPLRLAQCLGEPAESPDEPPSAAADPAGPTSPADPVSASPRPAPPAKPRPRATARTK